MSITLFGVLEVDWGLKEFWAKIFATLAQKMSNVFANSQSLGNKVLAMGDLGFGLEG